MKKTLLSGLTLGAALVLAACGNGGTESNGSTEGQTADGGSGEAITIEYWHGNADTQGGIAINELVDSYNESQDQVIVEPVYNSDMYVGIMQNLQTSLAGGDVPELVQIGWAYREYFQTNFPFTDPATLISEVGSDEDANYLDEKFPEEMLNLATDFEGNLLGFPYSVSTPVIFINPEIVEEAGVNTDDIQTMEDLYEAADTIAQETGNYGLYITHSNDNWSSQHLVESNGSQTLDQNGQAAFADEGGIQAYQDWADSQDAGATLQATTDEGHQAFISGDVGMVLTTIAQRTNITENAAFDAYAIELVSYEGQDRAVPAGGALLAVTAESEEEKAATLDFIQFLYEPENIAIWTDSTGYLPPTADATENDYLADLIENDQMFQTSYNQMPDLVPFASFPGNNGLQASEVLRDGRDAIFQGTPAEEHLPQTQDEINEML